MHCSNMVSILIIGLYILVPTDCMHDKDIIDNKDKIPEYVYRFPWAIMDIHAIILLYRKPRESLNFQF